VSAYVHVRTCVRVDFCLGVLLGVWV